MIDQDRRLNNSHTQSLDLTIDKPATYRIKIKGDLAERWSGRLGGMKISKQVRDAGTIVTTLEGPLRDQAALFGVLMGLYDNRLPLISAECLETSEEEENPLLKMTVERKAAYIEFIATGTYDLTSAIEYFPLVITTCRQANMPKALIDYRELNGLSASAHEVPYSHAIGEFHKQQLSSGGKALKVAFVGNEVTPWKIGEEIGQHYGMEALVTNDYAEAVAWLTREGSDETK